MPRPTTIAWALLTCLILITTDATATELQRLQGDGSRSLLVGGAGATANAEVDTFYLLGGPGRLDGRFEDAWGNPNWQGWTHVDKTDDDDVHWQVSEFQAITGVYSMWCGAVFEGGDHGYGNDWFQSLVFRTTVANNASPATVIWRARLQVDLEPNYDWVYLQVNRAGEWETLLSFDGQQTVDIDETFVVEPGDYTGPDGDEIQLRVRVATDYIWSDEDGLLDTDGACQIDDIQVTVDGVVIDDEDFEDQVSDHWLAEPDPAVGDFTHIWTNLQDEDPCFSNYSPQVAFVDDGVVVPGTGGTWCTTWCYGPGGYIVNNTGGLAGPDRHLDNYLISPVMEWPAGANAAYLQFEVFKHELLISNSAGIFYLWYVRSVDSGDPADLADARWQNRNFLGYGGPGYEIERADLTTLIEPGVTHVQVALRTAELGYVFSDLWDGADGTPAPYFDNIQVVAYAEPGPSVTARTIDLWNDGFPASGELDLTDLASNSVRLDMAGNISPSIHLRNDPGDTLVFSASTIRAGAFIDGAPRVHVRMRANPLFRDVRTLPPNFTLVEDGMFYADLVTGYVDADSAFAAGGIYAPNRWACDLPDAGFFYPGDVIHYYIEVKDNAFGDIGVSLLPADTSGFARFARPHQLDTYDNRFAVRALPSQFSAVAGDQPEVLLWDDRGDPAVQDEWRSMLQDIFHDEGWDYDLFATLSPTSAAGNGLGGRATLDQIAAYDIILYTAGDLTRFLLGNGDYQTDPSDDIGLLDAWLGLYQKNLLLTGDNVASELEGAGSAGTQFLTDHVGVSLVSRNIRPFIGDQPTPLVRIEPGNGVLASADRWVAYGGCPSLNQFDAVTTQGITARLAEFTDPAGNDGVYLYAAATLRRDEVSESDVVLLAHDLTFAYTDPGWVPPHGLGGYPVRTVMLLEILDFFGSWVIPPPGVPAPSPFHVTQYPNPFNPTTTFALDLPRGGDVSLKIYDLRGGLVRTLVDESLAMGHHEIPWHGTDDRGAAVASGVYFCETRADGQVRIQKMALVR